MQQSSTSELGDPATDSGIECWQSEFLERVPAILETPPCIVEPPNEGHFGAGRVVLCMELGCPLLRGSKCISPMGMVL